MQHPNRIPLWLVIDAHRWELMTAAMAYGPTSTELARHDLHACRP